MLKMICAVIAVIGISVQLSAKNALAELVGSRDFQDKEAAYALLEKKSVLSETDILFLIEEMKDYDGFGRSRPDGPDTENTQVTEILIQHGKESLPYLIRSLKNNDWNVRRYSAYCIGTMQSQSAVPELEKAIWDEVLLAAKTESTISLVIKTPRPATFVLRAMVQAYGRIDSRKAVYWLFQLFTNERGNFRNYAANYALAVLLKHAPVPLSQETMYLNYRGQWERWWKENNNKPDNELFEYESQRIAASENVKSDARADVSKLFKGYEETFLCEASPCSKDIMELFQMISDKTNISIRPIGGLPDEKYGIYRLSAKDTFLFLIDAASLTYQITDRTVTVSPNP